MRTSFFLITLAALLLGSCGDSSLELNQTKELNGSWMITDTLLYQFSDQELENKDLQIEIAYTDDFNYENIYLALIDSDNKKKVFSVSLANQKGQWIGKRFGKNYKLRKSISKLVLEGDTKFKIIHQAREDDLQGVVSIGVGLANKST